MATLKEKLKNWYKTRSSGQKIGDVSFWIILVLLLIPGPRKAISRVVNGVFLHVRNPTMMREGDPLILSDEDYRWMLASGPVNPLYMNEIRGNVIFLNFWATWCPPCVAELPGIQKAYETYGKRVLFILVTNEDQETVEAFMDKHGYDLPVFYPGTSPPEVLQVRSIPTTFIISKEGRVAVKKKGAANWDSKSVSHIFDELLR